MAGSARRGAHPGAMRSRDCAFVALGTPRSVARGGGAPKWMLATTPLRARAGAAVASVGGTPHGTAKSGELDHIRQAGGARAWPLRRESCWLSGLMKHRVSDFCGCRGSEDLCQRPALHTGKACFLSGCVVAASPWPARVSLRSVSPRSGNHWHRTPPAEQPLHGRRRAVLHRPRSRTPSTTGSGSLPVCHSGGNGQSCFGSRRSRTKSIASSRN